MSNDARPALNDVFDGAPPAGPSSNVRDEDGDRSPRQPADPNAIEDDELPPVQDDVPAAVNGPPKRKTDEQI